MRGLKRLLRYPLIGLGIILLTTIVDIDFAFSKSYTIVLSNELLTVSLIAVLFGYGFAADHIVSYVNKRTK